MTNKLFLLTILLTCLSAKSFNSYYLIKSKVNEVSKKDLISELRTFLDASRPNRFFGTKGHVQSQDYLEKLLKQHASKSSHKFKSINFNIDYVKAREHFDFDFDKKIKSNFSKDSKEYVKWHSFKEYMKSVIEDKKSKQAKNFEYYVKGSLDKEVILLAHYDTVTFNSDTLRIDEKSKMPGADYNGTGVSILLSIIKNFPDFKPKLGVRFIFLDAGALGFLGAKHYAKNLKNKDNILGVVNLEMLGHDSKVFDKKNKKKNMRVYLRSVAKDLNFLKIFQSQKKRSADRNLFEIVKNDFDKSDHVEFWKQGLPAIVYTQNWEDDFNLKRYQTKNDFPESINQNTFYSAYRFISEMLFSTVYGLD